jgi:hypothetical protein
MRAFANVSPVARLDLLSGSGSGAGTVPSSGTFVVQGLLSARVSF